LARDVWRFFGDWSLEIGAWVLVRAVFRRKQRGTDISVTAGYDCEMGILSVDMIMGFDESFFWF
jgi:hypothetical protein